MKYEKLIKHFENDEKILYRKNTQDGWNIVEKKDQLFSIHGYEYKLAGETNPKEEVLSLLDAMRLHDEAEDMEEYHYNEGYNEAIAQAIKNITMSL
jgi:hypothetical protein